MSDPNQIQNPARRRVLAGLASVPAAAAMSGCGNSAVPGAAAGPVSTAATASELSLPPLPDPASIGIDHFVVIMMENRSYDHFLGWVPGGDGLQAGAKFPDKNGGLIDTFHLAANPEYGYQGCGKEDPAHGYSDGRVHLNDDKMDGWLGTIGDANITTDKFPVGYYTADDLPFFKAVAENFTICDRYFHGILSSTFPNRVYLHAGETDRNSNTTTTSTLPTIWERLAAKNATGKYYFHDLPVTGLWGEKHLDISYRFENFLADAAAGRLANLSIIDPRFVGEAPNGVTNDDHPQADIRNGQAFLASVYDALRASPQWEKTLYVICYDEWGGFYDHVVPGFGPVSANEGEFNDGRLGFRVPATILGPRAKRGHVSHLPLDINSIVNMICWRFGAEAPGPRAATSLNLAHALNLSGAPDASAPDFAVPMGPFGEECTTGGPVPFPNLPGAPASMSAQLKLIQHNAEWLALGEKAKAHGFML